MTAKNLIIAAFSDGEIKNVQIQLIIPELATEIGLEENIVLQQIHYWIQKCGKCIKDTLWIYNTFEQWHNQFKYWSISKIKRIFYSLEKQGFIKSKKLSSHKANHTKWYSINYNKIKEIFNKIITQPSYNRETGRRIREINFYNSRELNNEKNFASFKNELSSSQIDTIIKSNTDNNLHNNYLSLKEESNKSTENLFKPQTREIRKKTFLESEEIICKNMTEVWSNVFIKNQKKILLTSRRMEKLLKVWNKLFNCNIEQWKNFCIAVNSSKFLMGEKKSDFKAYFDWVIEEETINKVLAGEFGVGDRIPDIEQEVFEQIHRKKVDEYNAKLEENALQRAEEERVRKIDKLAEQIMNKELKKLENSWTEKELEEAKNTFKSYVMEGANQDKNLKTCSDLFKQFGWNAVAIDFYFREFKMKYFLNRTFDWFRNRANAEFNVCN